ncbi:MAG: PP2C family protein-serine/threonine phosphatase [Brevinematia bacterium]
MFGADVWFWLEGVLAFFLLIFMWLNYLKHKESVFKFFTFIFAFLLLKSFIYIRLSFTSVNWVETIVQGVMRRIIDPNLLPLYNLKFFVFQALETIFTLLVLYFISYNILKVQEQKTFFLTLSNFLQIGVIFGITLFVVIYSVLTGLPEDFETTNRIIEMMKGAPGRSIFVVWRLFILFTTWREVARIHGYIASLLKVLSKHRRILFTYLGFQFFVTSISSFIALYAYPFWLFFDVVSVVILCMFAYGMHTGYIDTIQERIVNLNKERDTIIHLMKEISGIVGSGALEVDNIFQTIVDNSVKGTAARGGAILLKDPITKRLIVKYVKGLYPPTKPLKSATGVTLTESVIVERFKSEKIAVGEGLLGKVAETGETIYIPDVLKDPTFVQTVSEHLLVTSFIAVPLKTKDDVFGVLTVVDDTKLFLENDVSLLETLGEQAAITITQFQMYQEILEKKQAEKEIGVAAEIQSSLIPHTFPMSAKYDLYGLSIAAKGVGGDYYDYIDFGNEKIVLTMFDVSGKGVPAALIMVMIRSILRTIATLNDDTRDVMAKLNNTISLEIVEDRYATGFYLLFDAEKGIMSYTNAGHCPLILYRSHSDDFEFLDTEGMPIGIMSGVEYGQNYTIMERGDIAILYTDGITEAMNIKHEEFGFDRLKEVIRQNKRETAKDICTRVIESIKNFSGSALQHDDETILVLKMK